MIATIGEALVDLIEQKDGLFQACLGGSVCNFSLALARQDVAVSYLNPLSEDKFGRKLFSLLSTNGVHLANGVISACPTSLAVISLDAQGSPSYAFHRQDVAHRDISAPALAACFPDAMELLHTGGLALVPDDLEKILESIRIAKARNAIVSIDANLRPIAVKRRDDYFAGVRRVIREAHIVKVSDEDLSFLEMEDATPAEIGALFFDDSAVQLIALTRGGKGAMLLTRACQVEMAAPNGLAVVDTVGAGDCFHAGLVAWLQHAGKLDTPRNLELLHADELISALRHAISSASLNIMRTGCDPATWKQTVEFKAMFEMN